MKHLFLVAFVAAFLLSVLTAVQFEAALGPMLLLWLLPPLAVQKVGLTKERRRDVVAGWFAGVAIFLVAFFDRLMLPGPL